MRMDEEAYLAHYGTLRKSGRYPWGSGKTQSARNQTFVDIVGQMQKEGGMTDAQVAKLFSSPEHPLTSTNIRDLKSIAKTQLKQDDIRTAQRYADSGMSNVAIGDRMGRNESSVRALLAPGAADKADTLKSVTDMLRRQVEEKSYIDIGAGVHHDLSITEDKLKKAVAVLREEGYTKHYPKVQQLGTGNDTKMRVLGAPGAPAPKHDQIGFINEHSTDGGRSFLGIQPPISISSKRVAVRHAEDGGTDADGVIYVRPGVKDLSIGGKRYGQVRIMVDGTHYLKGMAILKEDMPPGVDLVFNTNKQNTGNKLDAMKPIKDDPDNPFGSIVRQVHDEHGKVSSAMNIVGQKEGSGVEGGWGGWSKNLASQVLSKQTPEVAKAQLDMTFERKKNEFNEIMRLTNPTVKKKLLESFADDADSSAVHLKAASLPGQATHVILPVNSVKPHEIYAPNYTPGTRVALIRYPHAGTFEIPELIVNNRNPEAKRLLGTATKDAVGIHHSVAERLSGADFDGDTVLVIPNNHGTIKTTAPLAGLKDFDSKSYKIPDDDAHTKRMTPANTQSEMGKVTNLISDMTIRGANTSELARAVRHSMVVIDAEKHGLDYTRSERDHGIAALKERYQKDTVTNGRGASTLITRAKSDVRVNERRAARVNEGGAIDPITGRKRYTETGRTRVTPDRVHKRTGEIIPGKTVYYKDVSTRLAETHDAHTLVSSGPGTRIERVYADHSNRLKELANQSRLASLEVKGDKKIPSSERTYKAEVDSINAKLVAAEKNAPLERQAQLLGSSWVRAKRQANPNMEPSELKKVKAQALAEARTRTGAKKEAIELTQREWDAIQARAISPHKLDKILANTDVDKVKELATPRTPRTITAAKLTRAKQQLALGYTQAEVAANLGIPVSTLMGHIE